MEFFKHVKTKNYKNKTDLQKKNSNKEKPKLPFVFRLWLYSCTLFVSEKTLLFCSCFSFAGLSCLLPTIFVGRRSIH